MSADIHLIALDMDGTLLGADHHTIPERNISALRAAAERGIHIAIASGRSWSLVREHAETLGCVDLAITANGAYALDTRRGQELASFPMDPRQCVDIISILRRRKLAFELYIGGENYMDGKLEDVNQLILSSQFFQMFCRNTTVVDDVSAVAAARRPGKFDIFYVPDALRAPLADELRATGPLVITGATGANMELNAPGVHKGRALAAVAKKLGLSAEQVMAFGDADNDLEMLEFAHWSFAMGNAAQPVKAVARFQTGPNDQAGVAQAVEEYVLGR